MAILIATETDSVDPPASLRDKLRDLMPDVAVGVWPDDPGDLGAVQMLVVDRLVPGIIGKLPNLRLVQKVGAGVERIVRDPALGRDVRVARLKPAVAAHEMAEYCLAYVLRDHRHLRDYEAHQKARRWQMIEPPLTAETTVGVLGLGHIGALTARTFAYLGFRVLGWARSAKTIDGVDCRAGDDALHPMLGACDYVCAILPSTPATRGLMDAAAFNAMKPGSLFVNVGRGDLVVDDDLIAGLDAGRPGRAVLDVYNTEPLPGDHPFWTHPRVDMTPHVSGWHVGDAIADVAENWRRLQAGEPLLHEIDRDHGY